MAGSAGRQRLHAKPPRDLVQPARPRSSQFPRLGGQQDVRPERRDHAGPRVQPVIAARLDATVMGIERTRRQDAHRAAATACTCSSARSSPRWAGSARIPCVATPGMPVPKRLPVNSMPE